MPFGEFTPAFEAAETVPAAGSGNRPVFPGETPTVGAQEAWARAYSRVEDADTLTVLRGGVPAKLAMATEPFDIGLLAAGAAGVDKLTESQLALQQIKVADENSRKLKYRTARLVEVNNEGGQHLIESLVTNAGLLRRKLKNAHESMGSGGAMMLDGAAIWKALTDTSLCPDDPTQDKAELELKKLEAEPLADGVSGAEFAARIVKFERDINPHLFEPKSDRAVVRWVYEQLPGSAHFSKEMTKAEALAAGKSGDAAWIAATLVTKLDALSKSMNKTMGIGATAGMAAFAGLGVWAKPSGAGSSLAAFAGASRLPDGKTCARTVLVCLRIGGRAGLPPSTMD